MSVLLKRLTELSGPRPTVLLTGCSALLTSSPPSSTRGTSSLLRRLLTLCDSSAATYYPSLFVTPRIHSGLFPLLPCWSQDSIFPASLTCKVPVDPPLAAAELVLWAWKQWEACT